MKSTDPAAQIAFSSNGTRIALCGPEEKLLVLETGSLSEKSISLSRACQSVAFDPTEQFMVAGETEGAEVWDVLSGHRKWVFSGQFPVAAAAFSSDGKVIATLGSNVLHLWTFPGLEEFHRIPDVPAKTVRFAGGDRFVGGRSI